MPRPTTVDVDFEGAIADYDCRVLTLSVLKGLLSPVVDEPVTFVNAPQLAEERGIVVRSTSSASARDYVNLVTVRGVAAGRPTHVAGTLYGKSDAPRIVGLDEHIVDLPPSSHMLVVRNDDVPGVIGMVGTILGDAGVNIDNMDVGRSPSGAAAMMAISTGLPVPAEVVDEAPRPSRASSTPRRSSWVSAVGVTAQSFAGRRPSASAPRRRRSSGRGACARS